MSFQGVSNASGPSSRGIYTIFVISLYGMKKTGAILSSLCSKAVCGPPACLKTKEPFGKETNTTCSSLKTTLT